MITPHRNPHQRCVREESLTQRAVSAYNEGKFPHTPQRSSLRHSGRRPPHPRRRDCLGSDARCHRTGGAHDPLRVASVHSVPSTNRSSLLQSIGLVSFSAFDTQVLRLFRAGLSRLAWPHQRGPATLPGSNREPKVAFGSMGDASIHGPHLVAWSVGSEWRNRHLHQKTIHPDNELEDQET
jgi:hypothetical protein